VDGLWQYLALLVILGHGIGHLIGVLASWTSIDVGFKDAAWLFPGGHKMKSAIGRAWGLLWIVAMVFFVGSALGILLDEEWWRFLAVIGSVVSLVAILPWWKSVIGGVKAGAVLDIAIILVLLLPWGKEITDFFEVP